MLWVLSAVLAGLLAAQDHAQQLQDARASGDRSAESRALIDLAQEVRARDTDEALALLEEAARVATGLHELQLATAHVRLDVLLEAQREREAVEWGLLLVQDHRGRGQYDDALGALERVLPALTTLDPPDPELEGRCAEEEGYVCELSGRFERARLAYGRALAAQLPHARRKLVLEHLALVSMQQGRIARAQTLVFELFELLEGEGEIELARHANTRATLCLRLGALERAVEHAEHAVRVLAGTGAWRERANVTLTMTAALVELGEHGRARVALEQLLADLNGRANADFETFGALQNQAVNLIEQRRAGEALVPLARAEALAGEMQVPWLEGAALQARADVHEQLGEPERAIELALRALAIFEQIPSLDYAAGSLRTVAAASIALGELERAAATIRRAEDILDGGQGQFASYRDAAQFRSRFERWGDITQDLTAARLAGEGERDEILRFGFEAAGRWKGRMLLEGIAERRGPGPRTWDTLERLTAGDAALIEFASGSQRLFAYVLKEDGLELVELGDTRELEAAVADYTALFAAGSPVGDAAHVARRGLALCERLVAPALDRTPDGTRHLTFVPTPDLAALPFEALVLEAPPEGATSFADVVFLGDRFAVTYAPSTPVLARLASLARPELADGRALIVADPAYRVELQVAARGAEDELGRLPSTREEALRIAQLIVRATDDDAQRLAELLDLQFDRSGSVSGTGFDLFVGAEASVARLRQDLSAYTLVHCAVHGVVDAEDPARSGLAFSWEPDSGGRIDLAEIRALELDAALVVLSACDTARGEVLRGEGVQSVAQAFLEAGSSAVVASLWQVRDDDTMRTMQGFYSGLFEEGLAPGEALRRAKRALRSANTLRGQAVADPTASADPGHPYYWAPFIYIGAE